MDNANRFYAAPICSFLVKSWCNRWLSIDSREQRRAIFVKKEEEGCRVVLVPTSDGRYMLQILPNSLCPQRSLAEAESKGGSDSLNISESHVLQDTAKQACVPQFQISGGSDDLIVNQWFLSRYSQLVVAAQIDSNTSVEDLVFSLEFDENGCVKFRAGDNNGYLTSDPNGHLWTGTQKARKWETFYLHEKPFSNYHGSPSRVVCAPVRINLKAHTGRYLCAANPIIYAHAEAPCCCEEFLLDLSFPPVGLMGWDSLDHATGNLISVGEVKITDSEKTPSSKCSIRTADGMCNFSAEADGMLSVTRVHELQGKEFFNLEVVSQKGYTKVSIKLCNNVKNHSKQSSVYLSADASGKLLFNKIQKRKWEEFGFELANNARILIRSVHGGFLGYEPFSEASKLIEQNTTFIRHYMDSRFEENRLRRRCSCALWKKQKLGSVGAWKLRAHGDSLYTLVAIPTPRTGADVYLFVDDSGRVLQSSEPGIHFPATASLFEIKPITAGYVTRSGRHPTINDGTDGSIIGFVIRTVRKINGKRRFLSAEPNGFLTATRIHASWWEMFQLVDVDAAAAAAASPLRFLYSSAAVNFNTSISRDTLFWTSSQRLSVSSGQIQHGIGTEGGLISEESLRRASEVAAEAVREGQAVPARLPCNLTELCIHQICLQTSKGFSLQDGEEQDIFGLPDDLFLRIKARWRARQHPDYPCKLLPSAFLPQSGHSSQNQRNRDPFHSGGTGDGWHCSTCDRDGVLNMDPTVNPAHHRYLEEQYRAHSGVAQPTGLLWNLISFAGVSIMSTALLFQVFTAAGRRNARSSH